MNEEVINKIKKDIQRRKELLEKAKLLELQARENTLDYEVNSIQKEIFELLDNDNLNIERITLLFDLLNQICAYLGHDYKFAKVSYIADSSCLETFFEEKYIHICSRCGNVVYLDRIIDENSSFNHLEKLRKARKLTN